MLEKHGRRLLTAGAALLLAAGGWWAWRLPSVQMAVLSRQSLAGLESRIADNPNDWRTQYWFGKRAAEAGDLARAEPALRAALGPEIRYLPAATELGKVLLAQGRVEEAFQVLRMVTERDPEQREARLALAQLYRFQGAYGKAMELLEALAREDPRDAAAQHELGLSRYGVQKLDAAEEALRAAVAVEGKNPLFLTSLARVRRERGDLAEAERLVRTAVREDPLNVPALLELARVVGQKEPPAEHRKEALDLLKTARELSPEHPAVLLEAGRLLMAEERWEEAAAALTTTVRLEPHTTPAYYQLAEAYRRLGRLEESRRAEAEFRKWRAYDTRIQELASRLTAEPESAEIRFRIGEAHAEVGRLEQAIQSYRAGLQRAPENEKARARMSALVRARLERSGGDAPGP